MTRLAAIICFILSLIFYQAHLGDSWSWTSWMLLGFILTCLDDSSYKVP
jgi:hypothetical protein